GASARRSVELRNTGNAPLELVAAVSGPGFSLIENAPPVLAAGASATLVLEFAPAAAGDAAGLLNLSASGREAAAMQLLARGAAPPETPKFYGCGAPGTPAGSASDAIVLALTAALLALRLPRRSGG